MVRRPAVRRAEVLAGLLAAGLVVALVLATVAKVRAAADQTKCSNNLRQLGLAVSNYESTYGSDGERLPPLVDQGDGAPTGRGLPSAFANLVPYIEATHFLLRPDQPTDHYNGHSSVGFPYTDKMGQTHIQAGGMANQVWKVFLDPADVTADELRDVPMTLPDGTTGYYAAGSYAANGLLPWGNRTGPASFPRGAENTILIAERPQVCRTAAGDEVYNLWGLGFYSPHMPAFACLTPADPPGLASTGQAAPAGEGSVRIGRADASPGPPDFPTPVQRVRAGRACDPRLPGGPHPGGMQVLMADGSVRVFGWDTEPGVFWEACVPDPAADGG